MNTGKKTPKNVKPASQKPIASTFDLHLNAGGELHQLANKEHPALTTNQGVAISDNQNSLRANPNGLEDFVLREKIMHFDHERIPERIARAFESDRPHGSGLLARHFFCRNRTGCVLPGKHRSRHHVREAIVGHLRHIDAKPSPALQIIGNMKETLMGRAYG